MHLHHNELRGLTVNVSLSLLVRYELVLGLFAIPFQSGMLSLDDHTAEEIRCVFDDI